MQRFLSLAFILSLFFLNTLSAQTLNDANAPLHALKVQYTTSYDLPTQVDIESVLGRVLNYLEEVTPAYLIDPQTNKPVTKLKRTPEELALPPSDFRLTSYEWGVVYAGMLQAGTSMNDDRYSQYSNERFEFILQVTDYLKANPKVSIQKNPFGKVMNPKTLDHAGAMCAAMIKSGNENFRPLIDNYLNHIANVQFRLEDGTLARNRPLPNTIWLDDLFMSVPALAQAGKLTGDVRYFDDACKQVLQFAERMFNSTNKLFMHGWVQEMNPHPQFHWARANGWAIMAMAELLSVLPVEHPNYQDILSLFQAHAEGLAKVQDMTGLWHQVLDRNDSYLETSATAIYTYAIGRGINRGWLDAKAYGPMVILGWNAVASKINEKGQVEGTCVGTGMAFDPAFYYHRPTSVYAAHGYGPVLLAGSEIYQLIDNFKAEVNDSALMFYDK